MHPAAHEGFSRMLRHALISGPVFSAHEGRPRVLDLGGADVNGTIHGLLPRGAVIDVVDIAPGPGVTIVADATGNDLGEVVTAATGHDFYDYYDLVISTEMLEHVMYWEASVINAFRALRPGGWFIGTCASHDRRQHGARGEVQPPDGEWYQNVFSDELIVELMPRFSGDVVVEYSRIAGLATTHDLYWRAQKGRSQ